MDAFFCGWRLKGVLTHRPASCFLPTQQKSPTSRVKRTDCNKNCYNDTQKHLGTEKQSHVKMPEEKNSNKRRQLLAKRVSHAYAV